MTWGSEWRAMPSNAPLPSKLSLWVMTIALLIGGNVVSAQEEPAADATEVEVTNESGQSDATDSPQSQTDPGAVLDYEPSESISEDLSVSFPVDI